MLLVGEVCELPLRPLAALPYHRLPPLPPPPQCSRQSTDKAFARFFLCVLCVLCVGLSVFVVLCLSDDNDTKLELHKSGCFAVAIFLTLATLEGKPMSMIRESQKGAMRI